MDLFEAIERRASVRGFEPCNLDREELEKICDAGRRAPSGYNRQPWEFIVIEDRDTLQKLGKIQDPIAEASAAIAVVADEEASKFWKEDAAAAIENMLLAIVDLGYASVWVEGYTLRYEDFGKEVLGIPEDLRLLTLLPIGKAAEEPIQAEKKPLEEIVHWEKYG